MEEMILREQPFMGNPSSTSTPSSALGIHRDSRSIAKVKPKIRIIHIFAPEIIKTDTANFRGLVQRLTGKSAASAANHQKSQKRKSSGLIIPKREGHQKIMPEKPIPRKMEQINLFHGFDPRERMKEEEGMMMMMVRGGGDGGGYLKDFADLDGFAYEMGGLPLLSADASQIPSFEAAHHHHHHHQHHVSS
ncbi:VQ motif-containing protein 17 [Eucalyptus grandis]|uniref:VQ motif-containing protein 17 n=1 Tax=Eucalyptus grandis TaxID=71139 RepID=UPI000527CCF6|nr:VQ motif-containing protein 17 [Eucalyptus grandis]